MITKEGTACMDAIDKAWAEYKEVDAKVIEVGATTDTAKSLQAQRMMTDEAAPKYQALSHSIFIWIIEIISMTIIAVEKR